MTTTRPLTAAASWLLRRRALHAATPAHELHDARRRIAALEHRLAAAIRRRNGVAP